MPNFDRKNILVVEDDLGLRELIRSALETEGYKVEEAENGREGLEKLKNISGPCLVLLDLLMPIMNGYEFLTNLRADTMLAPIPVIVVSSSDLNDENDVSAFIRKPADLNILIALVNEFARSSKF